MRYSEYVEASARTAPDLGKGNNNLHAALGMISEVGELADAFKRELAYGKAVDPQNILEEAGDFLWYMALYLRTNEVAEASEPLFSVSDTEMDKVGKAVEGAGEGEDIPGLLPSAMISPLRNLLFVEETQTKVDSVAMLVMFVASLLRRYGYTLEQAMQANIDKLMVRYPEKFTQDNALTRNIEAEMQAMEKAIESRDD